MKNGEYLTVKRSPPQLIARSSKLHCIFFLLQFIVNSVIIFFGNLGHCVWMLNNNLMVLRIAADILCVSFIYYPICMGFWLVLKTVEGRKFRARENGNEK